MGNNDDLIQDKDWVLFKLPSGILKILQLRKTGKVGLGKFGYFAASEIIGKYYDIPLELDGENVRVADNSSSIEIETNENANNQFLAANAGAQKLSHEQIESLKQEKSGHEMIKSLLENSATFDSKTDFAKLKYIKRKEKKYSKKFYASKITARSICDFYQSTGPDQTMNIRIDTLSQMMTTANVHAGSKLMVLDDANGLVISTVIERMGNKGNVLAIHQKKDYKHPIVKYFKHSVQVLSRLSFDELDQLDTIPNEMPEHDYSLSVKVKGKKCFNEGEFDGLIIAAEQDATVLIQKLESKLLGSRPIVVYAPYKQVLVNAFSYMRKSTRFVNVQMTESWMREYQLPLNLAGTHPHMSTSSSGGFLLSALTVASADTTSTLETTSNDVEESPDAKEPLPKKLKLV